MVGLSVHTPDPTVVSTGTVFFKGGTKTEGERWREEEGAKSALVTRLQHLKNLGHRSLAYVYVYSCTRVSVVQPIIIRSKRSSLLARRPRLLGVLVVQSVVQSIQILSRCVSVIPFFSLVLSY